MSDNEESAKKMITVTVKTPKEKQTVEVQENATISEVSIPLTTCVTDDKSKQHSKFFCRDDVFDDLRGGTTVSPSLK